MRKKGLLMRIDESHAVGRRVDADGAAAALNDRLECGEKTRTDEVGNAAYVDLAKVQMFFFTVVAALSYGVTLFYWIITKQPAELIAFPGLSAGELVR